MNLFYLSFDIQQSKDYEEEPNIVREGLIKLFFKEGVLLSNIKSSVASSMTFKSGKELDYWFDKLISFKPKIHFVINEVKEWRIWPDEKLAEDFDELKNQFKP